MRKIGWRRDSEEQNKESSRFIHSDTDYFYLLNVNNYLDDLPIYFNEAAYVARCSETYRDETAWSSRCLGTDLLISNKFHSSNHTRWSLYNFIYVL